VSEEIKELLFLLHNDKLTEAGKRKLEQEIERLNNIINEIEKSIDSKLKEFENNKDYFIDEITLKDLKNELQELKGSDKE